jgi:di/tricarboxylate transporter
VHCRDARLVRPAPAQATAWALSGFSNATVWLVFAAYMFACGYSKTGLGRRVALHLIRLMGNHTLGLGYAVTFADLALAPVTPSATARSGRHDLSGRQEYSRSLRLVSKRSIGKKGGRIPALYRVGGQRGVEQHVHSRRLRRTRWPLR